GPVVGDASDERALRGSVGAERVGRAIRRALDHGGRAIVERMREHDLRLDPREAVFGEWKGAEERRRDREGVNRGTDVVHESRPRQLLRPRAAADCRRRLVDHDAPPRLRHRNRRGEAVGARPDDDCIRVRHCASVPLTHMAKNFRDLTEAEILALAISLEEEDGRIYGDFADGLRETYPATARLFDEMQAEESQHRAWLIETYRQRFGDHIPLIRRQDVNGFVQRRPVWLTRPLGINVARKQVETMELETRRFYEHSVHHVQDAGIRKLLGDLAEAERKHYATAESLEEKHLT